MTQNDSGERFWKPVRRVPIASWPERAGWKGLRPVRWEPEGPPDPTHGGLGQPQRAGHGAGGPVGGIRRCLLQGFGDDGRHLRIRDAARGAGSGRIPQAAEPVRHNPLAPCADQRPTDAELGRNRLMGEPGRTPQDNPGPQGQGLTRFPPRDPLLPRGLLGRREGQRRDGPSLPARLGRWRDVHTGSYHIDPELAAQDTSSEMLIPPPSRPASVLVDI